MNESFWKIVRVAEVILFILFILLEVLYDFSFICHTDSSGKLYQTLEINLLLTDAIIILIDILVNKL